MKITNKLIGIALTAIAAGALVACTNELKDPNSGANGTLKLVRTPDVIAWSGQQYLENTRTNADLSTMAPALAQNIVPAASTNSPKTRAEEMDADDTYLNKSDDNKILWKEVSTDLLNTDEEAQLIDEWLPEKSAAIIDKVITDFLYYAKDADVEFEMFPVFGKSDRQHDIGIFYYENGESTLKQTQLLWDNLECFIPDEKETWKTPVLPKDENGNLKGVKIKVKQGTKFGFYWINNDGTTQYDWFHNGDPDYLTDHINLSFSYKLENHIANGPSQTPANEWWTADIRACTFYADGKTYLGFEDWTDFDYQDVVFTCDKLLLMVDSEGHEYEIPDQPEEDECPQCGHTGHNDPTDNCEECREHGPVDNNPEHSCWKEETVECPQCGHSGHNDPTDNCEECKEHGPVDNNPEHSCWKEETVECPKCGHKGHDSAIEDCEDCHQNGPVDGNHESCWVDPKVDPDPSDPTTPSTPNKGYKHNNEVEVNLELVDSHDKEHGGQYDIKDLTSKLSIHVRHGTDVKITIPVPADYTIDSDDLYIFQQHYNGVYGGELDKSLEELKQTVPYTFGDHDEFQVTLHVDFYENYIEVWTDGITPEMIDWLMEKNGDGLNFEIWTYFGIENSFDRDELLECLNRSTIEFLDSDPAYYINAFGYDYVDGTWGQEIQKPERPNPDDCTVTPKYTSHFSEPNRTTHLNGTPYNDIYTKDGVDPDHAHGGGRTNQTN